MTTKLSRKERDLENWMTFVKSLFKQINDLKKDEFIYYEVRDMQEIECAALMSERVEKNFALTVSGKTIDGIPYLYIRRVS